MKVCIISTSDNRGGGYIAAYRLHQGLQTIGLDSQMLVQTKVNDDPTVISSQSKLGRGWGIIKPTIDSLPLQLYRQRNRVLYSLNCLPSRINSRINAINPDIINMHWINGGYFPVEAIAKFNRPLVWTLHDMWAFTGGCHYSRECDRYQQSCGRCPILKSDRDWDWSSWLWRRKAKAWQNLNLTLVTPSKWLAECAKSSSLFKDVPVRVIPNGLDTDTYQPIDKGLARKLLKLPQDKQIILFGAISATKDPRKGFPLLQTALQHLSRQTSSEQIELVVFGSSLPTLSTDLDFNTHYLGYFYDDLALAIVYSAADVMVVPSTQEAFGQTASEALACGTPVVAFNATGLPDIVDNYQNGYLATPYQPIDLAKGIIWVLQDAERWQKLSHHARAKVRQEFTVEKQTERYHQLYKEILTN